MKHIRISSKTLIDKLNISKVICDHLFTENHSESHRMVVGGVILLSGVALSKIHFQLHFMTLMIDGIGYGIHTIGFTPFYERIVRYSKEREETIKLRKVVLSDTVNTPKLIARPKNRKRGKKR